MQSQYVFNHILLFRWWSTGHLYISSSVFWMQSNVHARCGQQVWDYMSGPRRGTRSNGWRSNGDKLQCIDILPSHAARLRQWLKIFCKKLAALLYDFYVFIGNGSWTIGFNFCLQQNLIRPQMKNLSVGGKFRSWPFIPKPHMPQIFILHFFTTSCWDPILNKSEIFLW